MSDVQTGYAEFNDTRTYYEIGGSPNSKTLVFLHAAVADRRLYDAQFAAFAPEYRVVRYDLRGAGSTEAPIPSATPFSYVDDLAKLLEHLKIERASLIGTSNGAEVALDFALTYPEQVNTLVLACASLGGYQMQGEPPPLILQIGAAMQTGDFERAATLGTQMFFVGENRTVERMNPQAYELARTMCLQALERTGAGLGENQGITPPAVGRLGEVSVPTLVIIGAEDHLANQEVEDRMAREIPGAQKLIVDTAHLPSLEAPDEFTRVVAAFLANATTSYRAPL